MSKQTGPKPIQSVVRAMSLLKSVAEHDGASCTELARAVGLKAQTALNLLRTLVQLVLCHSVFALSHPVIFLR